MHQDTDTNESSEQVESILVKVNGKPFRCHCDANCFHHPKDRPDVFECNACGEWYEGT